MKCPRCNFGNPEGIKFCGECGAKLERICPKCNSPNPPEFKFCGECGHSLILPSEPLPQAPSFEEKLDKIQRSMPGGLTEKVLAQRANIEGERKQVTVMFCDIVGFTALSDRLGPEEVYSIMDEVFEILIHRVHNYGGTVNRMTGMMALFGAPIAVEDAPQRAIRAALSIHREMARFSERHKRQREISPLKMRIGIHTGPVVVSTLGNDLRVEFTEEGDTVELASRMEGLAEPGTTYVTEDTFKLTEGFFHFEALGVREVKGREEPINVYRAIAPSTRRTRFDVSAERGLTPFVGRERELELLLDGFQRAKEGRGQAFSIMGEAGVGKSRLLYEFRKAVINENVTYLEGKGLSYIRNVAYHLHIDILKEIFDIREDDEDSGIREKVKRSLKIMGIDKASTLPYLLELLSVKDSGIDKILISPEMRKKRIIEALRRIVLKGSEIRPLILCCEDIHWVDKSSEDVLKDVLENIPGVRVFLIFTYRPEYVHTWGGKSFHSQLILNRLSNRESLKMVAYLLGTEEIDRDLEDLILEKTEGVPFFIEEFIKSLKNLKIIERKDNKYYLAKDSKDLIIPSTIQDMIMARVDCLPEGARGVLQIGSAAGREFSQNLIEIVVGLSERELLSHLSVLKDSELLYERGIYPQSTYIFKHALIQDAVYQSLLLSTRQKHHRKIAQVLEKHFPGSVKAQPELLAHHYTEAGLVEEAIPYWHRAGEIAIRRSADMEAINHLTKGLELLKTMPDKDERIQQELTLQIALGVPLRAIKGLAAPEVVKAYNRARELCQETGETPQLFSVLRGLWEIYELQAELQMAYELAEQLFSLAQSIQDPALLVEAHYVLGDSLLWIGELASARTHQEQGIALYDLQQHRSHAFLYGYDIGIACLASLTLALWHLGYPEQALRRSHESLNLAHELSHAHSLAFALDFTAWLHLFRREAQSVQEQAERMIALSTEHGFEFWLAHGTFFRGWALGEQGQEEEGIALMHQGLAGWRAAGAEVSRPYKLALLAGTYGKVGQIGEGFSMLNEALDTVNKTKEHIWEAELYRLKGELLLASTEENQAEAETCFQQAINIARHQNAKSFELRAVMSLSRLWQKQDKKKETWQGLEEVYRWFTEGFDTPDLKEAKALFEELSD